MSHPRIHHPEKFIQFYRGWKVVRRDVDRPIAGQWEGFKGEDITIITHRKKTLLRMINIYENTDIENM